MPQVTLELPRGLGALDELGDHRGVPLASMFGTFLFLFLTYYLQQTLGCSPVVTGLAFLPMAGGIATTANLSNIVPLHAQGAQADQVPEQSEAEAQVEPSVSARPFTAG